MARAYQPREAGGRVGQQIFGDGAIESAGMRAALAALHGSYALVGQTPPEPPTWRGRIGAQLVKLVQRLLFWYTPQIVHFQYSVLRAFEELARELEAQRAAREALELRVRNLESELEADRAQMALLRGEFQALEVSVGSWKQRVEAEIHRVRPQILAQEQRIALLLREPRSGSAEPARIDTHDLDAWYAALEDEFRGSRDEIRKRLSVYLPTLEEAAIGSESMPILDVGCGRGEWLELLKERHLHASGIDTNRVLLAICQERGVQAVEADAISYLNALPDESLGAVTAFHLIEHLPLARLLDLLDATVRVLKPGGAAIFETPNPNSVMVAARYFYLDPTHRHPIPPLLGKFLAESRGLCRVEILELNPWPPEHHLDTQTGGDVAGRFNDCFYGPQDYAIIGWKVPVEPIATS